MLGVYITLKNDENLIEECWKRVALVFPHVEVCDLGSLDTGPDRIKKLGGKVVQYGDLSPVDYTAWKNEMAKKHSHILWIDADEWWPKDCLKNAETEILSEGEAVGYWRNLKIKDKKLLVSEPTIRGRVGWYTKDRFLVRAWPKERLTNNIDPALHPVARFGDPLKIYCWHGIFLERSSLPEDKKRKQKRIDRENQFSNLSWTETKFELLT